MDGEGRDAAGPTLRRSPYVKRSPYAARGIAGVRSAAGGRCGTSASHPPRDLHARRASRARSWPLGAPFRTRSWSGGASSDHESVVCPGTRLRSLTKVGAGTSFG